MQSQNHLSFFTLLLMISFASVNAVLFTPALPDIVQFFAITEDQAQLTITWFLIAYAIGQLLYGPIANRYGRKPALYIGIGLQIVSSLICVLAGFMHTYALLIVGRFLMALGSGVGLKMTFTLVNECYDPKAASKKVSYLMLAFAITPGLGVALGGILNANFGWESCFYACAIYGVFLLFLTFRLPETLKQVDVNALKVSHLIEGYSAQFRNFTLVAGGLLMGSCTTFVYVFAALAPFIAINLQGMTSAEYGIANLIPPIGLVAGSLVSAKLVEHYSLHSILKKGILIGGLGTLIMLVAAFMHLSPLYALFLPMVIIYFGLCFVMANASTVAMSKVKDKAHGSAVMSFINMGFTTLIVLSMGFFPVVKLLLPFMFIAMAVIMFVIFSLIFSKNNQMVTT